MDRHLAITSTDSGEPSWWAEKLPGRDCRNGIGYSPRLQSLEGLLWQTDGEDRPGFDEWFIFEAAPPDLVLVIRGETPFEPEFAPRPGRILALVNWYFAPSNHVSELSQIFWDQIGWIGPESYVSDGSEFLTFVTRNHQLLNTVFCRLRTNTGMINK